VLMLKKPPSLSQQSLTESPAFSRHLGLTTTIQKAHRTRLCLQSTDQLVHPFIRATGQARPRSPHDTSTTIKRRPARYHHRILDQRSLRAFATHVFGAWVGVLAWASLGDAFSVCATSFNIRSIAETTYAVGRAGHDPHRRRHVPCEGCGIVLETHDPEHSRFF
jgi:hypothetical protein